jgi:hypothetical protein
MQATLAWNCCTVAGWCCWCWCQDWLQTMMALLQPATTVGHWGLLVFDTINCDLLVLQVLQAFYHAGSSTTI